MTKYTCRSFLDPMVVGLRHFHYFNEEGKRVGQGQAILLPSEDPNNWIKEHWDEIVEALDNELALYGAA